MKNKKSILLIFGLIMMTQMIYAQTPYYVPTNGLVGYWPFNGNANDESGNGNNGTENNVMYETDRNGNTNSCLNINGNTNRWIDVAISNQTLVNQQSKTFSMWIKLPTSYSGISYYNHIITPANLPWMQVLGNYPTYISSGNINKFVFSGQMPVSNQQLNDNLWHNIIVVCDNTFNMKLYLDGLLVGNQSFPNSYNFTNLNQIRIGNNLGNLSQCAFAGQIDDIGIWNRTLTQQEITNMYNGVNYSSTCNSVSGSLVNGLVGYWPFCGNANDQSGNGNNGTVNGATLTTDRFGDSNSAYSFNGTSDFIKVLDNNVLKFETNNKFTLSYWIDATTLSNSQMNVIISKQENAGFNQDGWNSYVETTSNNGFRVQNGNSTNPCATNLLTPIMSINNYYHIVQVYDNGTASIYINGVLGTQQLCSSQIGDNLSDLFIGKPTWTDNSVKGFNGVIDDIGIWNRALTQQEITALYNGNICYQTITVTDTLLINMGITGFNPVTFNNTIKIFPNPTNDHITIDYGNFASLNGYQLKITNSLGQQMFQTNINQQSNYVSLASWGGNGLYFVYIIDPQGNTLDIRKIVLQ